LCGWHRIAVPEDLEAMTRSEASRFIDRVIAKSGRMDLE